VKNKLSSILKQRKSRGFTLVELLIVIAIIAILVLLVIVALDPLERIRDAQDRNAQNSVRSAAAAIATCITKESAKTGGTPFTVGTCDDAGAMQTAGYISNQASLNNVVMTADGTDNICAEHDNDAGHGNVYWTFQVGTVSDPENVPASAPAPCTIAPD